MGYEVDYSSVNTLNRMQGHCFFFLFSFHKHL